MYEKLEECPSCRYPKLVNQLILQDSLISGESFALVGCANCHLRFLNPRPTDITRFLAPQLIDRLPSGKRMSLITRLLTRKIVKQQLSLVHHYNPQKLLNIASGVNSFRRLLTKSRDVIQVQPITSEISLPGIPKSLKFEMITCWEGFGHAKELKDSIKQLRKKLVKDGKLLIHLANPTSPVADHFGQAWAAYDAPRSMYFASPSSAEMLFTKTKFNIVERIPCPAYNLLYVLVSTFQSQGSIDILQALRLSRKTNNQSRDTDNYCSYIYVLEK